MSRPILGTCNAGELASSWVLKREKAPQPGQESENKEAIINASRIKGRSKGRIALPGDLRQGCLPVGHIKQAGKRVADRLLFAAALVLHNNDCLEGLKQWSLRMSARAASLAPLAIGLETEARGASELMMKDA